MAVLAAPQKINPLQAQSKKNTHELYFLNENDPLFLLVMLLARG